MTGSVQQEKRGNIPWVRCPKCRNWHHVSFVLLRSKTVPMHCPQCHHEFNADEAEEVIEP